MNWRKCVDLGAGCRPLASGCMRGALQEKSAAYSILCEYFFLPGNAASNPRTGFGNWLLGFVLLLLSGCSDLPKLDPLRPGDVAPPFTLTLTDGRTRTLESYHGRGLVITFMASWCPCSNESLPLFQKAYETYRERVDLLMIGIQEAESQFLPFVAKRNILFDAGYDRSEIARRYGVNAPPTTVFIDREGRVKRFFYGNIKEVAGSFPDWVAEVAP